jgi:hypothetical protein
MDPAWVEPGRSSSGPSRGFTSSNLRTRYEIRADLHLGLLQLACSIICYDDSEPLSEMISKTEGQSATGAGHGRYAGLPQAGLEGPCNGSPGGIEEPRQQFTSAITGKGDAKARYRVLQYANADQSRDATRGWDKHCVTAA